VAPSDVASILWLVTLITHNYLFIKMTVTNLFNKLHAAQSFQKLTIHHLINKFPAIYDTWKITVSKRACHMYIT